MIYCSGTILSPKIIFFLLFLPRPRKKSCNIQRMYSGAGWVPIAVNWRTRLFWKTRFRDRHFPPVFLAQPLHDSFSECVPCPSRKPYRDNSKRGPWMSVAVSIWPSILLLIGTAKHLIFPRVASGTQRITWSCVRLSLKTSLSLTHSEVMKPEGAFNQQGGDPSSHHCFTVPVPTPNSPW